LKKKLVVGLKVTVTGQAVPRSGGGGGQITKIHFDWGDGNSADTSSLPASHNYINPGKYNITITAYDSNGLSTTKTMPVVIKEIAGPPPLLSPPNRLPVANAGTDQTVNADDTVTLDGTKSTDSDGIIRSYSWIQTAGPTLALSNANTAMPSFVAPSDISSDTLLTFKLTVTDNTGAKSSATVNVTVKYVPPTNQPPTANAGSDQIVNAGDTVTLDGSKSMDPDGNITSYSWIQISGPAAILNGADKPIATFTAPKDIISSTDMTFQLTVADSKNATNTATVKVTDKYIPPANQPPTASASSVQTANAGDIVILDGSGSTDPDGNITSYSWMQTDGPAITLSSSWAAEPTFIAPSVSSDTELKFSLTVTDDKGAASSNPATVVVTVKAAAAAVPSAGGNMTSAEGVGGGTNMTSTAAQLPSSDANELNNKGAALDSQGNYAEAISYYDKALAIDPNDKNALNWKQKALSKMGR